MTRPANCTTHLRSSTRSRAVLFAEAHAVAARTRSSHVTGARAHLPFDTPARWHTARTHKHPPTRAHTAPLCPRSARRASTALGLGLPTSPENASPGTTARPAPPGPTKSRARRATTGPCPAPLRRSTVRCALAGSTAPRAPPSRCRAPEVCCGRGVGWRCQAQV